MEANVTGNYVHPYTDEYVLVRTYGSGVHCGYLKEYDPQTRHIFLTGSRRVWQWEGAFTLNAVATIGIKDGKMPLTLPEIMISDVLEIMKCTTEAGEILRNFPVHTP